MLRKFLQYIDLRNEIEDFDKIHEEINKGITFKGTNLWILVFAIIVASVGLNTNSTAVVIGAMLISPLMGPINGIGYSLATYNFELFRKSISNFGFAVGASLVTSTLYFLLSPVSTAASEILARTSPTIYDVIIALFGGLAGIVAVSSKLKGNVIPGVAIATALMPPLCTAGYGLASGNYSYFFGAFYLFTINSVFIAISSLLASRIFRFPITMQIDAIRKRSINRWLTTIILVTILPSLYFGYALVKNEKFAENANRYIDNVTIVGGSYLIKNDINPNKRNISLIYGGNTLSNEDKNQIKNRLKNFDIAEAEISISQGFSSNIQELNEAQQLRNKLNATLNVLNKVNQQVDSLKSIPNQGQQMYNEIKPLFPQIKSCSYSVSKVYGEAVKDSSEVKVIVFSIEKGSVESADRKKIVSWLNARIGKKNVIAYFVNDDSIIADSSSQNK
ncbi:MAG: DUF389 domain-containing protein [Bacteroidia bacterium]